MYSYFELYAFKFLLNVEIFADRLLENRGGAFAKYSTATMFMKVGGFLKTAENKEQVFSFSRGGCSSKDNDILQSIIMV